MHHKPENERDEAEIIQLYSETSAELRRLLYRKLGNEQEAEEIAQDAYLRLYRSKNRGKIRDLRKYLFTVGMRLALNVIRRRKTETNYLLQGGLAQSGSGGDESGIMAISAGQILAARQQLQAVQKGLQALPGKTRYVFLLNRFEGLTYAEIAKKLGLSVKAVEYHMKRALDAVVTASKGFNP